VLDAREREFSIKIRLKKFNLVEKYLDPKHWNSPWPVESGDITDGENPCVVALHTKFRILHVQWLQT